MDEFLGREILAEIRGLRSDLGTAVKGIATVKDLLAQIVGNEKLMGFILPMLGKLIEKKLAGRKK